MGKKCKLDDLGSVGRGRSRHRPRNDSSLYGGKYPFFQTGDIKNALLYLREYSQTYNETGLSQSKLWAPGTLCITIAANIAETAILGIHGCFPDSIVGFIPNPSLADARFIKYYIDWIKISMQSISKGTTQDNLSIDKLLSIEFDVPEVIIQKRIANILSSFDVLIENNRRRIQLLEEMAKTLYREWFVHFRFPGHEDVELVDSELGEIPEGWRIEILSNLADVIDSLHRTPIYSRLGYPMVRVKDVIDGFLQLKNTLCVSEDVYHEYTKKRRPKINNLILSRVGSFRISYVGISDAFCLGQNTVLIVPKIGSMFLYYSMQSTVIQEQILSQFSGTAYPTLSLKSIRKLKIVVPPMNLKDNFEKAISTTGEHIAKLQQTNSILSKARDMLLPRLVSGQLDVSP